eukprot:158585_1
MLFMFLNDINIYSPLFSNCICILSISAIKPLSTSFFFICCITAHIGTPIFNILRYSFNLGSLAFALGFCVLHIALCFLNNCSILCFISHIFGYLFLFLINK